MKHDTETVPDAIDGLRARLRAANPVPLPPNYLFNRVMRGIQRIIAGDDPRYCIDDEELKAAGRAALAAQYAERPIAEKQPPTFDVPTFDEVQQPTPKPKRKPGGGRKRIINDDQMDKVIKIIRSNSKLKGKPLLKKLDDAGIEGGNTTLYKAISAARKFQK